MAWSRAALQEHFHIIKYQRGNQPTPVLGYQCRRCWFWVICASTADLDPIKQCQDHLALGHFESMCATCPTRSTPSACPVRWHTMSWSCPRCQRPHTNVSWSNNQTRNGATSGWENGSKGKKYCDGVCKGKNADQILHPTIWACGNHTSFFECHFVSGAFWSECLLSSIGPSSSGYGWAITGMPPPPPANNQTAVTTSAA